MATSAGSGALAPQVLAPSIAAELGLSSTAVEAALRLLAQGAHPPFVARHRADRVEGLGLVEIEAIQATAARMAELEFHREALRTELERRGALDDEARAALDVAESELDLDDLRLRTRKRKRGPASKARGAGMERFGAQLWVAATRVDLPDPLPLHFDTELLPSWGQRAPTHDVAEPEPEPEVEGEAETDAQRADAAVGDHDADASAGTDTNAADPESSAPGLDPAPTPESPDLPADADAAAEVDAAVHAAPDSAEPRASVEPDEAADRPTQVLPSDPEGDAVAASPVQGETALAEQAEGDTVAPESAEAAADGDGTGDGEGGPEAEAPRRARRPAEPQGPLEHAAVPWVRRSFPTIAAVLAAGRSICAERIAESPVLRRTLRDLLAAEGVLHTQVVPGKQDKASRYKSLFDQRHPLARLSTTKLLTIVRAEREGLIRAELDIDDDRALAVAREALGILDPAEHPDRAPWIDQFDRALREAWQGTLGKAVRTGVRRALKQARDRDAIATFRANLRPLLMAPAFGLKTVLAIDPGFQHGCRIAVVDAHGAVLAQDTIYPLEPKLQAPQSRQRIAELVLAHDVAAVGIAHANGGRELERLCREMLADPELGLGGRELPVVLVDADAAALWASSKAAKDQLKDAEAALRRAVGVARRLQDPLLSLAQVDLCKLGLGQHQHEVNQDELRRALDAVLEACIAEVGLDVNHASEELLSRLPGLGNALAKALVSQREAKGPFKSRTALLEIPGFSGKVFEQAAGFLRIVGGEQPLDATPIHPERYATVAQFARKVDATPAELLGQDALIERVEAERDSLLGLPSVTGEPLGERGFAGLLEWLRRPFVDPRPAFQPPVFDARIAKLEDLEPGMEVEGVVTHLTNFGVFIDIGLPHQGLVHVSELSHGFVATPGDAVHVGQRVKGKVLEISLEKKRFSMSLKALQARPERPERPQRPRRRDDDDRPRGDRPRGDDGPRGDRPHGAGDRRKPARDRPRADAGAPAGGDAGPRPPRDRDRDRPRRDGPDARPRRDGPDGRPRPFDRDRDRDRDRGPKREEKTLNFRLDLSSLIDQLGDDER